jgi:hypothetical protein
MYSTAAVELVSCCFKMTDEVVARAQRRTASGVLLLHYGSFADGILTRISGLTCTPNRQSVCFHLRSMPQRGVCHENGRPYQRRFRTAGR